MPSKEATCFLLLALATVTVTATTTFGASPSSRFHIKRDRPPSQLTNRRAFEQQPAAASSRQDNNGFDPDILNRFLEEYASKIKRVTERPVNGYEVVKRVHHDSEIIESSPDRHSDQPDGGDMATPNDTIKRHKFYGSNTHQAEDRNSGWVTLEAIPWSKSKISKWQANPTTQGPWPGETKPWDNKPSYNKPPWNSEPPSRPSYDNEKPWQNKIPNRPHWSDSSSSASNKPWYSDRPQQDRPGGVYASIDKYEENPGQAQKWPPERPAWDRYGESSRPSSDIITDNGPPNFPTNNNNQWDRPGQRPSYVHQTESFINEAPGAGGWHDRNDFPAPSNNKFHRPDDKGPGYYDRPNFSQYQYPSSAGSNNNLHPQSHPATGDGQWVLLSTNRGYSKSRQRSIKLDNIATVVSGDVIQVKGKKKNPNQEEYVPAMTSKRQVRLTVLPSINGTNTTTSHGGLLEVEKTFKTVDQSQKEYEMQRILNASIAAANKRPVVVNKRPIRNTLAGVAPSNSAVLAAVGAGMLPATMAMMIPMMLGRRKREVNTYLRVPERLFEEVEVRRRM